MDLTSIRKMTYNIACSFVTPVPCQARQGHYDFESMLLCRQRVGFIQRPERRTSVGIVCTTGGPTETVRDVKQSLQTKWVDYTDNHGHAWTFPMDTLHASSKRTPLLLLHSVASLGASRKHWDPFLDYLSTLPSSHPLYRPTVRFDWLFTYEAGPKPRPKEAPDARFFEGQLQHICRQLSQPPIVVSQGTCEPLALYFVSRNPDLVRAFIDCGVLSEKYYAKKSRGKRNRLAYLLLSSPFGYWFFRYCARDKFIRAFTKKNLFAGDHAVDEWVSISLEGTEDARSRFAVFSFFCAQFLPKHGESIFDIKVPTLVVTGTKEKISEEERKNLENETRRLSVPVDEKWFEENRMTRLWKRSQDIKGSRCEVLHGYGNNIWFEFPKVAAMTLQRFLIDIGEK